jgi:hypothetical protein
MELQDNRNFEFLDFLVGNLRLESRLSYMSGRTYGLICIAVSTALLMFILGEVRELF